MRREREGSYKDEDMRSLLSKELTIQCGRRTHIQIIENIQWLRYWGGVMRTCQVGRKTASKFEIGPLMPYAVDFQLHSIIPHMDSHLGAKRYTCSDAKCSYPGYILLSKPCTYGAASTQGGHFFQIHTKATYVLAVALNTWIIIVSCLSRCQQCYNLNVHR